MCRATVMRSVMLTFVLVDVCQSVIFIQVGLVTGCRVIVSKDDGYFPGWCIQQTLGEIILVTL